MNKLLTSFYSQLSEVYRLSKIENLLHWDQQVVLPVRGAEERGEQLELVSRLIHQRLTAPTFLDTLDELYSRMDELQDDDRVNVREAHRSIERKRRIPESFVAEKTRVISAAFSAWTTSRPKDDFQTVEPHLQRIIKLIREEAQLVGYKEHPYDAMLDEYEPGAKLSQVKPLLVDLGDALANLLPAIRAKPQSSELPQLNCPESTQVRVNHRVLRDLGYHFEWGRLDTTHHPFQSTIGPEDIRITTRYNERNLLSSLFTTLHEAGHALYEAGLPKKWRGTALGTTISLGVHESQSRLWENMVGRSHGFARYLHRVLKETAPELYERTSPDALWAASNHVTPSLIRVEADEVTYSLHIVIRLQLEEQLLIGALEVRDLPDAWDKMYERYLGMKSANRRDGVLQDVHWYSGLVGYFPTYALGNIYGAMLLNRIHKDIPELDAAIEAGQFAPLLSWLNAHIHQHGMRYSSVELIERASHDKLSSAPFIQYIRAKFGLAH